MTPSSRSADITSPTLWGSLEPGPHAIGYRRRWEYDYARVYDPPFPGSDLTASALKPRPILVDVWYPAGAGPTAPPMLYREYLRFEGLAPAFAAFAPRLLAHNRDLLCQEVLGKSQAELSATERADLEALLQTATAAVKEAEPVAGPFPLVISHQGLGGAVEDNTVLYEWLASHGYVIATSAFQSENAAYVNIDWDLERSDRDLNFLVNSLRADPAIDLSRLGVIGQSYGGQAAIAWRAVVNSPVGAVVSLDATIEYAPPEGKGFEPLRERLNQVERMAAPMLLFARPTPRTSFAVYEPLQYAQRFYAQIPHLNHNDFIAHGAMGADIRWRRDPTAHEAQRVRASYDLVCRLTRSFLDASLKQDPGAAAALQTLVTPPTGDPQTFSLEYRPAVPLPPTGKQLMDLALARGVDAAVRLWDQWGEAGQAGPLYHAGRWLLAEGHRAEALRLLQVSADRSPEAGHVHEALGDAYRASGQGPLAANAYERAIDLYRHHTATNNPEHLEWMIQELSRRLEELRRPPP